MKNFFYKLFFSKRAHVGSLVFAQLLASATYAYALNISDPQEINTKILCPIAGTMFYILITLATIMVIYAAFLYVTASGDAEKVSKAHKTILYAAAGVVVALLAKGFPAIIASILGDSTKGLCP